VNAHQSGMRTATYETLCFEDVEYKYKKAFNMEPLDANIRFSLGNFYLEKFEFMSNDRSSSYTKEEMEKILLKSQEWFMKALEIDNLHRAS